MDKHVLVIGSDPANVESLGRHLHSAGFEVIHTHDVLEGKRQAFDEHVGLVLLDLTGDNQGLDAVSVIREGRLMLPVIVLSDRAEMRHRLIAFEAGASDVLIKPFSFDELVARLRAHLRRSAWS